VGRIKVHVTFIGGGFGRRLIQDYAVEAALPPAKLQAPVQVIWTREDDIRPRFLPTAACHSLQARIDAKGNLISWLHCGSSPSIETFYNGTGISPQQAAQVDSTDFPRPSFPISAWNLPKPSPACPSVTGARRRFGQPVCPLLLLR